MSQIDDTHAGATAEFLAQVAAKFDMPEPFLRAYFDANFPNFPPVGNFDEWWQSLTDVQRLHTEYALTTNTRAKEVYARCVPHLRPGASSHLDIGCGQGGTLRAFNAAGFRSMGIEIDPNLFRLSQLNCAGRDIKVHNLDITRLDPAEFGTFDCITCNAVIEHVSDPPATMRRIARLLSPGGLLMMEVPNRDFIDYVREDGHFLQFGLTQLTRQEARAMKHAMTGQDDSYEHMGEYYSRSFYVGHLTAAGLTAWLDPAYAVPKDSVPERLASLLEAYRDWSRRTDLPHFSRQLLEERFAEYCSGLFAAYRRAHASGDWSNFSERYLTSFWCVMARKPG